MNALEKMRELARLEEERKNAPRTTKYKGDPANFPIGNIPDNTTTTLRFTPDGDENNPWPWVERNVCKLLFDGQVGGEYATDEQVEVTVTCIDQFNPPGAKSTCPIILGTRHLWKDENDAAKMELARQYYKKKSFIYQGFVNATDVVEEEIPENPLRTFTIYPSVHNIIKSFITDTDFEDAPTDYLLGRDFRVKKTKTPGAKWPLYTGSSWSTKITALKEEQLIAIQQYGLLNLGSFLGEKPDADGVAMIKAMFEDSFAGRPFDFESYGHVYKAWKLRGGEKRADADAVSLVRPSEAERVVPKVTRKVEHVEQDEHEEETVSAPSASSGKPSSADILKKLQEKHKKAS